MMKFAFALLCLIAAASAQTVLLEARTIETEITKDGNVSFSFTVSNETATLASGTPKLNIWVDFVITSVLREIHLYSDALNGIYDEDGGKTIDLASYNCTHGCTVPFKLLGICTDMSCINSITTKVTARVQDSSSAFIYSTTKKPYMPIYANYWTQDLEIASSSYLYYNYEAAAAGSITCRKSSSFGSSVLLLSGGNTIEKPTQDNSSWVMIDSQDYKTFVAGDNTLALYGTSSVPVDTEGAICIGDSCLDDPASAVAPIFILSAISAFIALF